MRNLDSFDTSKTSTGNVHSFIQFPLTAGLFVDCKFDEGGEKRCLLETLSQKLPFSELPRSWHWIRENGPFVPYRQTPDLQFSESYLTITPTIVTWRSRSASIVSDHRRHVQLAKGLLTVLRRLKRSQILQGGDDGSLVHPNPEPTVSSLFEHSEAFALCILACASY